MLGVGGVGLFCGRGAPPNKGNQGKTKGNQGKTKGNQGKTKGNQEESRGSM